MRDYKLLKIKIFGFHCHNISSLSRKTGISAYKLKKFFDPNSKHTFLNDLCILDRIATALHLNLNELLD